MFDAQNTTGSEQGVLALPNGYTFARSVGITNTEVGWAAGGSGGFAAPAGGTITVLLNGTTGTVAFGSANFVGGDSALRFGSTFNTGTVRFGNGLQLATSGATLLQVFSESGVGARAVLSGVISGSGVLSVGATSNGQTAANAAGTLELTNSNTYSGPTIVRSGTLLVNNPFAGSGTGTGTVSLGGSATLGGSGRIAGPVQSAFDSTPTVAPGADLGQIGTLTVGKMQTSAGTRLLIDVSGLASDKLVVTDAGISFYTSGLRLEVSGQLTAPSYLIAEYAGSLDAMGFQSLTNVTEQGYMVSFATPGQINLVPVPEPAVVLAAAAVGLGLVTRRTGRRTTSSPA